MRGIIPPWLWKKEVKKMNKQELIKHFEEMEYVSISQMGKKAFIDMIEQLDEPQKPVVPQFVADWIEECKNDDFHLFGAMEGISSNQKKIDYWFREDDNMELFARAWLDGYEVEKERRYLVKIKGIACPYLNHDTINELWFYNQKIEGAYTKTQHTRKELEEANFGWVFDCPGIEIEEVEG